VSKRRSHQISIFDNPREQPVLEFTVKPAPVEIEQDVHRCPECNEVLLIRERITRGGGWQQIYKMPLMEHRLEKHPPNEKRPQTSGFWS
jgi:uncharacterized protein with PIN domain